MKRILMALGMAATLASAPALADDRVVKIGVLTDMGGPAADATGEGLVQAVRMAVEDFGGKAAGKPIEVVAADMQGKVDVGSSIAREWLDQQGVDVIMDVPHSAVALAVNQVVAERNKVFIGIGAATTKLTGDSCTANTVQWAFDTYAAAAASKAVVQNGGDSWYFITADYAFGHDMEKSAAEMIRQAGGKVVGGVRVPLNTPDMSSFLLQAQASGAKVIGLATVGNDTVNVLKQAAEFGIGKKSNQRLYVFVMIISDVHAMGLKTAQGAQMMAPFYWDADEETRAWSKRFAARYKDRMPSMQQAGAYSATLHYLKAVEANKGSVDGKAVVARMKAMPTEDALYKKGSIRVDGRKLHPIHVYEIKTPEESKHPWDYQRLLRTLPPEQAFRPLAEGGCALAKP